MKNIKNLKKPLIKSVVFRIFTAIIFVFTVLLYLSIVGLLYLRYSGGGDLIYTQEATHFLVIALIGLFVLGWFFIYILYIGMIKPVYDTFNIVVESVDTLVNQENIDRDQVVYLNEFIKNSLNELHKSSLIQKMNISPDTEGYIKKLSELINQNESLASSKKELSNLVIQLEKQHKLLELEKAKTSAIIDSLPNGLLVTSKDGNIFLVNQELERILGIKSENLLGKFVSTILPNMSLSENLYINNSILEMKVFEYQSLDNKKKITIENTYKPIILNNNIFGIVYILRDATQEKSTERAQKEFVSLASHQLRTPITSIKWNAEIILSSKNTDSEIIVAANDIYKESFRMEKLINSLLNLSRIDLGKIKFSSQEIYLDKYIDSLLIKFKLELLSKNLVFEKNIIFKGPIINDPVYIDIIIGNILYNSIKYSNKNGVIKFSVNNKSDLVCIQISDTGIGIPSSQQSQIFSRLFRADNAKNYQPDGNGLGLYIVKKLVDMMNGNVWFESKENQGTTFFIELPIAIKK